MWPWYSQAIKSNSSFFVSIPTLIFQALSLLPKILEKGKSIVGKCFLLFASMSLGPRRPAPLLTICQLQTALKRNDLFEPAALYAGAFVHPSTLLHLIRSKWSFINCVYRTPLSCMDFNPKHLSFVALIYPSDSSDHFWLLHYTSVQKIIYCAPLSIRITFITR